MARIRLDQALVQKGQVPSREQARRLIMAGEVMVGDEVISKPGWLIREDANLTVKQPPRFVSRGGLKLEGALNHFHIDVTGWVAMDVGASTGASLTACCSGVRRAFTPLMSARIKWCGNSEVTHGSFAEKTSTSATCRPAMCPKPWT